MKSGTQRRHRESSPKMETEIRVMRWQAKKCKDCQNLAEAKKQRGMLSLGPSKKIGSSNTP